jgi:hypothetical protein
MWFALMGVRGIYTKKMSLARVKLIFFENFCNFFGKMGWEEGWWLGADKVRMMMNGYFF